MKKILFTLVLMLSTLTSWAYDVKIDGIYYNLVSKAKEAEVTNRTGDNKANSYSGSVTIPSTIEYEGQTYTITSIGKYAFSYCTSLTSITIPTSVTNIGSDAFSGCTSLTSITINENITSIGSLAFYGCKGLTSVNINSIEAWCKLSFDYAQSNPLYNAHNLYLNGEKVTNLVLPNSITSIGDYQFIGCSCITSITIPTNIKSIGSCAFTDCSGLQLLDIPNSVTTINNYAFANCSGLNTIIIPNSINTIGQNVFRNCSSLKTISIPNNITSIELGAFSKCSNLTSITLPNSIQYIKSESFSECKNLEIVTCYSEEVPSTSSSAFQDSYVNYATLIVPEASVEKYKQSAIWGQFGTFKTIEGTEIPEPKKCTNPTIAIVNGTITATSTTEGSECHLSYTFNGTADNNTFSVLVSAYATAEGYEPSEKVTETLKMYIGERGDVNGDGHVSIADVNTLVDKLLDKSDKTE